MIIMSRLFIVAIMTALAFPACTVNQKQTDAEPTAPAAIEQVTGAEIIWDTWGVPHIYADNEADLFYAQGWAQMHAHANLIVERYGAARGRGAEYWGASYLQDDQMIHLLGFPELAEEWTQTQDPELQEILTAFVAGMNAYAEQHPDAIAADKQLVLPMTVNDVNLHSLYVIYTRFIGGGDLGRIQQWEDMGSNAYAISPQRSASGHAMLVQNPHLPWWREFTFFENHLRLGDRSLYGVNIAGFPGLAIAFNRHLGWTHTDNTLDNADTYELPLQDGGYLIDGQRFEFRKRDKTIRVKQEDGTFTEQPITIRHSRHGPVVRMGDNKALAIRMAGQDRPNAFLQWWRMANSTNLEEFETALQMAQIPFWNVTYADRHGDIFYIYNGLVPKRSHGDWADWNKIVPGGKSTDIWKDYHAYAELPKVKNPATGWLQNANDPPWTSTIPQALQPDDFPEYMAPTGMALRPQRAARMLLEDESITFDELVSYKLSTRLEMADRLLDDLAKAVAASDSEIAKEAMQVLDAWDKSTDVDSKGAVLFANWATTFQLWQESKYTTAWDPAQPTTTPDGIAAPEQAVEMLEIVAKQMKELAGTLEVPWGMYFRIKHAGKDLPGNGAPGFLGAFRVAWPSGGSGAQRSIGGGDSWVAVIEFGEQPRAKVLLSYGNATQTDSPHYGDQLELFSTKTMRDAWFQDEVIREHQARVETLQARSKGSANKR